MSKKTISHFFESIRKAKTEEEVKHAYAKYFDITYNTADRMDLYTSGVLFEFKYDRSLKNIRARSHVLAQSLYYVRQLKYGVDTEKTIPPFLCLADVNEAVITETIKWQTFYDDRAGKYDWDLTPSCPDPKLVDDIEATPFARDLHVYNITTETEFAHFADLLVKHLENQLPLDIQDKKVITEDNFESVFEYWNKIFGDSVRNGFKTSRYFVSDIQKDNTYYLPDQSRAIFRIGQTGELKEKKILRKDYEHFWSLYYKVNDMDLIRAILAKIDRLTDENMRRFHGEFFTPLRFAQKSLDYIEKTVGERWWKTGEYRLWDMAAGTGNLEYHLPQEALKYCYLSTLYKEDTEHLDRLFSDATVFQYDYLNDDIENIFADKTGLAFDFPWKLPQKIRDDLANPAIKWIILINPPFATAQKAGTNHGGSKEGVADTRLRKQMHTAGLGEVSRELFSQFLYRIKYEFADKDTHLALFSKIKYINSNNDQNFRDDIFDFAFKNGFVFSVKNFSGTKGDFPVGMLIWKVNANKKIEEQNIEVDIFNEKVEKIGTKSVSSSHRSGFLSKWITRPSATIKFPPFGSAILVKCDNMDRRDRVAEGFLASLMCCGNDFQHQNMTAFFSGPYVSAGSLSVTPANFEQAMVVHAARRIPKATWLNDRDQFMKPQCELSDEFITDCAVWGLFSNSNQTAALRNVQYEGETYQVHNHLFPFRVAEVKMWDITDRDISLMLVKEEDRFAAQWLAKRVLSPEAQAVLDAGRKVYQLYFTSINQLRTPQFKIETYDAGLWQLKQALTDASLGSKELNALKTVHDQLKAKLFPRIIDYGIIE
jgi:hypothetical protein